jgi:hypothetical protein
MAITQRESERLPRLVYDLFPTETRFAEQDGNIVHHVDDGSEPILPTISRGALRCK